MHVSIPTTILTLLTLTLASPIASRSPVPREGNRKRQFTSTLTARAYNQWQIADGQAAIALSEAEQRFPIIDRDPLSISDDELKILKDSAELATASETGQGGSDERISQAQQGRNGQNANDVTVLQNGRTKMRVMQHQLTLLALQVENARGEDNLDEINAEFDAIEAEIATDQGRQGQSSRGISDTFVFGLAQRVSK